LTSREKSILLAVSACHALIHAYMLVFPTIYKSVGSSLKLEFAGVGFVGMASYLAFGFGSLPAGFLSDRIGAGRLLVICIAGTTGASVLVFTLSSTAGVVVALVLLGLFASMYHPAGLSLLSTSIREVGKALGLHGMAGMIGIALAPSIAGEMTSRHGWASSYLVLGAAGGVIVIILLALLRFHTDEHLPSHEDKPEDGTAGSPLGQLLLIFAIGAVYGLIYRGLLTFFPSYLSERVAFIGNDVRKLGYVTSSITAISIAGPLLGGYLASTRRRIEANLLLIFALLALLLVGVYFGSGLVLILIAVPIVLLLFGFQPLQNTLIAKVSHSSRRGAVYGIHYTASFGLGALASGIGGVVGERFGLQAFFLLIVGLCLVGMLIVLTLTRLRKRSEANGLS
jgi:MFS family permease